MDKRKVIFIINNSLITKNPTLAKEWHPARNGSLTPGDVAAKTGKKVWWICSKGHEWEAIVSNRGNGTGCPYCAGKAVSLDNCLQTINPTLAKEWHPARNGSLTPRDVTAKTGKKVWWICSKGHEWEAIVSNRSNGTGCPHCYKQSRKTISMVLSVVRDITCRYNK